MHAVTFEGEQKDCADVALASLARSAEDLGAELSVPFYDSKAKEYSTIDREDFSSRKKFSFYLQMMIGAQGLQSQNRITSPVAIADAVPGDLFIWDLTEHGNAGYTGHTMVIIENSPDEERVKVIEGHVSEGSVVEESDYTYQEILDYASHWPEPSGGGARRFNASMLG